MSFIITDGAGTGKVAKVNQKNRLNVNAEILGAREVAALDGAAFFISAEGVTLTSDSESAVFYYKNTGTEDLILVTALINASASTGGSGLLASTVLRNPTAGTIVDNAVAASQRNFNFGSSSLLTGDLFKGVEGDTFTDGTVFTTSNLSAPIFLTTSIVTVLTPGTSVGLNVTPPTGNTSMDVTIGFSVYLDGFGE